MGGSSYDTLVQELRRRGSTVSVAESLTGGELAARLSAPAGASAYFLGGVVSYSTGVKLSVLGVAEATASDPGVVSARCAREMASGVRRLTGSDWSLSTTGVAGPDAQEDKPVGLVYVAVAGEAGEWAEELHLPGDRTAVRAAAVEAALDALLRRLRSGPA